MHAATGQGDLGDEVKRLRREIDGLKAEEQKLLGDYLKDIFSQDALEGRAAQVKLALQEKEQSLSVLKEQQRAKDDAAKAGERVAEYCQRFWEGWTGWTLRDGGPCLRVRREGGGDQGGVADNHHGGPRRNYNVTHITITAV